MAHGDNSEIAKGQPRSQDKQHQHQNSGKDIKLKQRVSVVLLTNIIGPLDYSVKDGMTLTPGDIVTVPLGPRTLTGIVWDDESLSANAMASPPVEAKKLRPVTAKLDIPPLSPKMRQWLLWVSQYYMAPLPNILRMAVPGSAMANDARPMVEYSLNDQRPERMTSAREKVYAHLQGQQGSLSDLAQKADVSDAVLRNLVNSGFFERHLVPVTAHFPLPDPEFGPVSLSEAQIAVSAELREAVATRQDQPIILDGVTGSGKTEVYFEAIAEALDQGRQTLILLPEIALTQPFLARFEKRFGAMPVAWHSGLKQSERRRAWRAIANGTAKVVVGARSSLFLPYSELGLIIIDEAHEVSFKQDDGVRYNARDVAVMRGQFEKCPVILASATPAIETHHMGETQRYKRLELPSRYGGAALPDIIAVDLRETPPERGQWLAPPLVEALEQNLTDGHQSLLFLNRRGYAPLTLCRTCGHRIVCPNCSAWMVEHRLSARLACHHCGHVMPPPEACPECGEEDCLVACGPGVERIADEVKAHFPGARTMLVTSDTIWSPALAAEFVAKVENEEVDIIVGTQLVTKGYHFPKLTLVGVVDADIGLEGGDLRASERSFQQITQVSGRAGRSEDPGRVYIQTRNPETPVMAALLEGDRDGFYAAEIASRELAMMPPFGRLAAIIISSESEQSARSLADHLGQTAPRLKGFDVYGPAPAPLAILRGRYRYRLLVQAKRTTPLQQIINDWLANITIARDVRLAIDVDPYSFV